MRSSLLACVAVVLLGAIATPASAQSIIGRIKAKVKQTVQPNADSGANATASTATASTTDWHSDPDVVPINAASLDKLALGLAAEVKERKAVAPTLAAVLPYDQWQACQNAAQQQHADSGTKTAERYQKAIMNAPDHATAERLNKEYIAWAMAQSKASTSSTPVAAPKCGHPSNDFNYLDSLQKRPGIAGAHASGLTERQYFVLKERVAAVSAANGSAAGRPETTTTGGTVHVKPYANISSYVFDKSEFDAVTADRARLDPLLVAAGADLKPPPTHNPNAPHHGVRR